MGKSTEETAMELDGEGTANFEQLQDLIQKECDKPDRKYARLEEKFNKLEQQVTKKDKKHATEGPTIEQRRDRRLEEKRIKQKASYEQAKRSLRKRTLQQSRPAKPMKFRKPRTSRRKKEVPGKKTKTNLCRPRKTNQLGIHAILPARKNSQGCNNEKTNCAIRFRH